MKFHWRRWNFRMAQSKFQECRLEVAREVLKPLLDARTSEALRSFTAGSTFTTPTVFLLHRTRRSIYCNKYRDFY